MEFDFTCNLVPTINTTEMLKEVGGGSVCSSDCRRRFNVATAPLKRHQVECRNRASPSSKSVNLV